MVTAVAYDSQGTSTTLPGYQGAGPITVTANTASFGYVDQVFGDSSGTSTVAQNSVVDVDGWAGDQEDGSPVARVTIYIDGAVVGNARLGLSRPDLGTRYSRGGWAFSYNIGNLAPGTHMVTAVAYDSQGRSATLPGYQGAGPITVTGTTQAQTINHVIFMLQENRTFDSYFGMLNPYRARITGMSDNGQRMRLSSPNDEQNEPSAVYA